MFPISFTFCSQSSKDLEHVQRPTDLECDKCLKNLKNLRIEQPTQPLNYVGGDDGWNSCNDGR